MMPDPLLEWADSLSGADSQPDPLLEWADSVPESPTKKVKVRRPRLAFGGGGGEVEIEVPDVKIDSLADALIMSGSDERVAGERRRRYIETRLPFSPAGAEHTAKVIAAAKRMKGDEASEDDYRLVADFLMEGQRESEKGYWRKVGDLVTAIPGFATEFLATGGLYRSAKGALTVGARSALDDVGKSATRIAAEKAVEATIPRAAGVAAQTAAMPRVTVEPALRRMLPKEYGGHGESPAEALPKGFVDGMIEVASERLSGPLGRAFSGLPMPQKAQAAVRAYQRVAASDTPGGRLIRLGREAGYHGPVGEVIEERAGEVGRAVLELDEWPDYLSAEFLGQLGVEGVAFSIPAAAGAAIAKSPGLLQPPSQPDQAEAADGVSVAPGTPTPSEGPAIDESGFARFPDEYEGLGIPREEMPQVTSEQRGALANFARARGVDYERTSVLPTELRPSQAEYSPEKVQTARDWEGPDRAILVSEDGFVIDGHHQWLRDLEDTPDEPIDVIRLSATAEQAIELVKEFPSSQTSDETAKPTSPADQEIEPGVFKTFDKSAIPPNAPMVTESRVSGERPFWLYRLPEAETKPTEPGETDAETVSSPEEKAGEQEGSGQDVRGVRKDEEGAEPTGEVAPAQTEEADGPTAEVTGPESPAPTVEPGAPDVTTVGGVDLYGPGRKPLRDMTPEEVYPIWAELFPDRDQGPNYAPARSEMVREIEETRSDATEEPTTDTEAEPPAAPSETTAVDEAEAEPDATTRREELEAMKAKDLRVMAPKGKKNRNKAGLIDAILEAEAAPEGVQGPESPEETTDIPSSPSEREDDAPPPQRRMGPQDRPEAEIAAGGAIDDMVSPERQRRQSMGAARQEVASAEDLVGDYSEPSSSRYASPNKEFEGRYQKAKQGISRKTVGQKLRDFWDTVVKSTTRGALPELPRTQRFGEARSAMHSYQAAPQYATFAAKSLLGRTVKPLDANDFDLFTRVVILRDLNETEGALPFGLDSESAAAELERLEGFVRDNEKVQASLDYRQMWLDAMKNDYIDAHAELGIDVSGRLNRENYFRHQVLFYHQIDNMQRRLGKQKANITLSREWLKKRHGSELDINANYFQAEWQVATQMIADTQRARAIARLKREYDIKPELDAKAAGQEDTTWKDLIPDGYTPFVLRPGRTMFQAYSIPEMMAQELMEDLAKTLDIDASMLRPVMAMGSEYAPIVIPDELAAQMDSVSQAPSTGLLSDIDKGLTGITRAWKRWALHSPRRFPKYSLRNMSEVDKVVALNPQVLRKVPQAVKDLWKLYSGADDTPDNVREWVSRGGAGTLVRVNELGDLDDLKEFARLVERKQSGKRKNIATAVWRKYWDTAGMASDFRESILRYAAYLEYLEQIQTKGAPNNYGGSMREEVEGIPDARDKAMRLSADLLGDYSDVSVLGQWLRSRIFPFWSFQETNVRTYYRGVRNLASDEQTAIRAGLAVARSVGAGGLAKSPLLAYKLGRIALLFYGAKALLTVINRLFFPDDDDELDEDVKRNPHITLGRARDGTVRYFSRLGTSTDVLDWIGVDSIDYDVKDVLDGRKPLGEIAKDYAMAPLNKGWNSLTPLVKTPGELISGVSTYPRVDERRAIRDRWEHLARVFGLENEYKAIAGKPTKGYLESLGNVFFYRVEPGIANYYAARDLKYRWSTEEKGAGQRFFVSPKSDALFNYKQALRFTDTAAATRYLELYSALGGTKEGIQQSLRNMLPMSGLSVGDEAKFWMSLSPADREKVQEAEQFAYENLMTPQQAKIIKGEEMKRIANMYRRAIDGWRTPSDPEEAREYGQDNQVILRYLRERQSDPAFRGGYTLYIAE